jgi:hypothetical protein
MGCIYNYVCSSLVALFLWQQVTNLAAVMHTVVLHPVDMGVYQIGFVFELFVDLCNLREICVSNVVIHWAGG